MNLNDLYTEVSDKETIESSEGYALDPIQVGQVCSIYNDKVLELTGIDLRAVLRKAGIE